VIPDQVRDKLRRAETGIFNRDQYKNRFTKGHEIMKTIRLFVLLSAVTVSCVFGADKQPAPVPVIEDGFFIMGQPGLLTKEAGTDKWSFIPDEPIEFTEKITFPAGKALPLLPCSVLEQMTGLAGEENQLRVELSALFTEYKHKNHLFSVYFLPLREGIAQPAPEETKEAPEKGAEEKPAREEPVEDSIIPAEILQQIKTNKSPDLEKFMQIAEVTGDMNLIGRSGYLSETEKMPVFLPDAFGMKVNNKEFTLLPNSMLTTAEKELARRPGRQRFNVSGLVTTYKGQAYMLLRRANRTYTHGNFTP
jgi:hypothetical protein